MSGAAVQLGVGVDVALFVNDSEGRMNLSENVQQERWRAAMRLV